VIKIATGDPVSRDERKVVTGAAMAAAASGLPIVSHTENSRWGEVQQEILAENGVDLTRCLIGHLDQVESIDVLGAIADRGSFVGIDRIGFCRRLPDERRVELVAELVRTGRHGRVCLSQDHLCFLTAARPPYWVPRDRVEWFEAEVRPELDAEMFARPHTYLLTDFVPRLLAAGLDEAMVDQFLVHNPRRLLAGAE
jgi:phosphotriesterase-related protein